MVFLLKKVLGRVVNYCLVVILSIIVLGANGCETPQLSEKPNFVIIYCDDMGYGDLGCFGSELNLTTEQPGVAAMHHSQAGKAELWKEACVNHV